MAKALVNSDEDRKAVAVAFVIHGSVKEAAKVTGVPDKTIYRWVKSDWWPNLLDEAKREHQELIEGRLSNIVELATAELLDRIENGDVKYVVAKGKVEMVRVPVPAKELAHMTEKLGNALRTIRNQPTKLIAEAKFDATALIRDFANTASQHRERIVSEQ